MKSKIFSIIWLLLTVAVLAAWVYLILHNGRRNMEAFRDKEEEMTEFYAAEGVTTEAIVSQWDLPDSNGEHIITNGDMLSVGALRLRVPEYRMIDVLSDIPNDILASIIEEDGGLEDRFMYGYYEVELENTGDSAFSIYLSNIEFGMLDERGEIFNFLEPFYFEYTASDRCEDPESTELLLQPGEIYRTGIVGQQIKETMEDTSYCLIYDPYGRDPFDMSDDDIFYLFLR